MTASRRTRPGLPGLVTVAIAVAMAIIPHRLGHTHAAAQQATAQDWPQRAVKLIVPLGPGSGSDIGARLLADRVQARWGKPVTIENRPGGDGLVGVGAFASANDDHVLLYGATGSFTVHPYQHERLPYDLDRDVLPIAKTTITVIAVGVPAAMGIATLKELVGRARAEPGRLNVALTPGSGELVFNKFLHVEKLELAKVPYRDIVQAGTDVGEGRIHVISTALAILQPHVERGRIKLLAVTNPVRSSLAPDVPTAVEAGVPSLEHNGLNGLFGPRTMSPALRQRLGADVVAAFADPAIAARLAGTGQNVDTGGPEKLARAMAEQIAHIDAIARLLAIPRKLKP